MLWTEGAPQYRHDANETITEYIDQHVTCSISNSEEMNDLVTDMLKDAKIAAKNFYIQFPCTSYAENNDPVTSIRNGRY